MGTSTRAPYKHRDGSNCWTKNCRLDHATTSAPGFVFPEKREPGKPKHYGMLQYGSSAYNQFIEGAQALAGKATAVEVKAAYEYSGWAFKEFYAYLEGVNRDGSEYGSQHEEPLRSALKTAIGNKVASIDSLISKAGRFNKPVTVFRGEKLPENVNPVAFLAQKYPVGSKVHNKRFLSTSMEPNVAVEITGDKPSYVMVIEANRGAMLGENLSEQGLREREVLLPRDADYEVIAVETSTFGTGRSKKQEITVRLRQL